MPFINYNGQILPADTPIFTAQNRAFRYGDALFESVRMFAGKLPFLRYHYDRLTAGMCFLGFEISPYFSVDFFEQEIRKLTTSSGNYRIRCTVFRENGGLYTPKNNATNYLIEVVEIPDNEFIINENGLNVGLYDTLKLTCSPLSNLKTSNALPYVLAARFCQQQQLDDCLILNEFGRVGETFKANIFFVKNDKIYTPNLSEGCINGVLRRVLIEHFPNIIERPIELAEIAEFDAVFITNATQGVQWVRQIQATAYQKAQVDKINQYLNEFIGQV